MLTPPTVNRVFAGGAGEQPLPPPNVVQPPPTVKPPFLSFAVMRPLQAPATICSPTKLFATVVGALVSVTPVAVKVVVADEVNVAPTMNTELLLGLVVQPVPVQLPTVKPPLLSFAVTVAPHEPATT